MSFARGFASPLISRGGGSGSVSPIGASLDLIFRDPLGVEFGAPRTIAGTTTVAGWPNLGTFTRASTADWINVAGDGLETQAANNVLRRGPVRGALFERGQTAHDNNATGSGFVAGSPGTLPTGWNVPASINGLSRETIGPATRNGVPGFLFRYSGTPTVTGGIATNPGLANVRSIGDTVAHGMFIALEAGSLTNTSGWQFRSGSETVGATDATPGALRWITNTRVLTATDGRLTLRFVADNTVTPVDFTLFVGGMTTINGGPILSPIITSGAGNVSRAADQLVIPVSVPETTWTIAGVATMPGTPDNTTENLLNVTLSSPVTERFILRRNGAGGLVFNSVVGNIIQGGPTVTAPSSGSRFGFAVRRNGSQLSFSVNSASLVNNSPTLPSGVPSSMLVGHRLGGDGQWNSYIERIPVFPTAVSDATMQTYSTLATWGA